MHHKNVLIFCFFENMIQPREKILLPISKSLYIRKLIYEFVERNEVGNIPVESPSDVQVVYEALVAISQSQNRGEMVTSPVVIDVRDCGAAYRFLMAVLAVTPGQWLLTGNERLLQRPIEELVKCLRSIGADIQWHRDGAFVYTNDKSGCWSICGKNLHASELTIDCHQSGQFASALLLIANRIGLKTLHILPENPPSASYIQLTKAVVNGDVDLAKGGLWADWSAAVYWYARLLLERKGSYVLSGLDLGSIQPDVLLAKWFAQWGVESRQEAEGVVVSVDETLVKPQEVIALDMSQNPDLVPVMACMACLWPQKMVFNGVANLKYKESDRLKIIQEQLSPFATIALNPYNGIEGNQLMVDPINGRDGACTVSTNDIKNDVDFVFDAHNDHRFVMGFSLFAVRGKVLIKDFDSVRKSYPHFHVEGVVSGTDIVG